MSSEQGGMTLQSLTPEQLGQLKQQLESDIDSFQRAFDTLRAARGRFAETRRSLDTLAKHPSGAEVLVPLTSSLYVPGRLTDTSKVIVDLGTGYFMGVSVPHAVGYYNRRIEMIGGQMDKVADTANEKVRQRDMVTDVLRQKLVASGQIRPQQ